MFFILIFETAFRVFVATLFPSAADISFDCSVALRLSAFQMSACGKRLLRYEPSFSGQNLPHPCFQNCAKICQRKTIEICDTLSEPRNFYNCNCRTINMRKLMSYAKSKVDTITFERLMFCFWSKIRYDSLILRKNTV